MSDVKTYNPKKVIVTANGIPISGVADGTFVEFERSSDSFEKHVGSQGEVSRTQTADKSGSCTITLAQTSPSNDLFSGLAQIDELTGAGVIVLACTELSGSSVLMGAMAWIKKPAKAEFGKAVGNRQWVFDIAEYEVWNGGNVGVM